MNGRELCPATAEKIFTNILGYLSEQCTKFTRKDNHFSILKKSRPTLAFNTSEPFWILLFQLIKVHLYSYSNFLIHPYSVQGHKHPNVLLGWLLITGRWWGEWAASTSGSHLHGCHGFRFWLLLFADDVSSIKFRRSTDTLWPTRTTVSNYCKYWPTFFLFLDVALSHNPND